MPWSGSLPAFDGVVDETGESLPGHGCTIRGALLEVGVHSIEQHAPYVVLMLVPGAVAHPYRGEFRVAGQVVDVFSVRSFSPPMPYMICSSNLLPSTLLPLTASRTKTNTPRLPVEARGGRGPAA